VGDIQWVQLIKPKRVHKKANGDVLTTASASLVLDHEYPYARNKFEFNDSPGSECDGFIETSVDDSFETWFMWKPSGTDSIYVPLAKFTWDWGGTATQNNGAWPAAPANPKQPDPKFSDTTVYPEWTLNFTDIPEETTHPNP
jgi:hypothetical protein